jgi:hypothetical protein
LVTARATTLVVAGLSSETFREELSVFVVKKKKNYTLKEVMIYHI